MGKALQIILVVIEGIATFFIIIPIFLWLLINYYYVKYKANRNRKNFVKLLKREGLTESFSTKMAEHIFPKMELASLRTLIREGQKTGGKSDR